MNEWHYEKNGQRHGPISTEAMQTLIEHGALNGQTLVWATDLTTWLPLANTQLAIHLPHSTQPPALPASHISNTVIWVLALAPLLGLLLESALAGMRAQSELTVDYEVTQALSSGQYWYVTLLLNCGLSLWDERRLKAAGVDTAAFGKLVLLVPVYLWKRAQSLHQRPAYFWTWLSLFGLSLLITR